MEINGVPDSNLFVANKTLDGSISIDTNSINKTSIIQPSEPNPDTPDHHSLSNTTTAPLHAAEGSDKNKTNSDTTGTVRRLTGNYSKKVKKNMFIHSLNVLCFALPILMALYSHSIGK